MHQNRQRPCKGAAESNCGHLCLLQTFSRSLKSLKHTCQLPITLLWRLAFSFQVCSYWGQECLICPGDTLESFAACWQMARREDRDSWCEWRYFSGFKVCAPECYTLFNNLLQHFQPSGGTQRNSINVLLTISVEWDWANRAKLFPVEM